MFWVYLKVVYIPYIIVVVTNIQRNSVASNSPQHNVDYKTYTYPHSKNYQFHSHKTHKVPKVLIGAFSIKSSFHFCTGTTTIWL